MGPPGTSWNGYGQTRMLPCDAGNDRQRWHKANHWKALRAWNTDQCLVGNTHNQNQFLGTFVCDITGQNPSQHMRITEDGQFVTRPEDSNGQCITRTGDSASCDGRDTLFGMQRIPEEVRRAGGFKGPALKEWRLADRKVPLEMQAYKASGWEERDEDAAKKASGFRGIFR